MPETNLRLKLVLTAALAAALLAGCSSPAVTGMKVHMQNQEYQEVVLLADSIIADGDSLNPEVWFWRGKALTEMNQWTDAAESFLKAHRMGATEEMAVNEYWFTFFNSAANTLNEGDIGAAVEMLEAGMEVAPRRPDFQLMLGDIELNVNDDLQAALDDFTTSSAKARDLVADLQEQMDQTSDQYELEFYAQSLQQAEDILISSLFNTGSVLTMMALDADDDQTAAYVQQAREAYQEALEVDPTSVDVLDALAAVFMVEENYRAALDIYDETIENIELGMSEGWLEPEEGRNLKANIMVSKGYAFIEMEEYGQAIDQLSQARELIGDDYIILASMAHANFVMEDYHEAISELQAALDIQGLTPEQIANAYYSLYANYNRLEMDEEAAAALETALQFEPERASWWRYLASTYSRLGRRTDAIEAMETAEELESGS
ncbi:MAG: tetratricopeptide repeat protein [Candidatus Aegiribacteria sp.]